MPVVECGVNLYLNKNRETLDSMDPHSACASLLTEMSERLSPPEH